MKITTKFWIGLGMLVVISPLGLLLPEHFKAGRAWGEWGIDEIQKLVGYIPKGLSKFSNLWNAPFPDYTFRGGQGQSILGLSFSYILSAGVGVLICIGIVLILGKFLSKK
jgi:cobalt/nickel transport protein